MLSRIEIEEIFYGKFEGAPYAIFLTIDELIKRAKIISCIDEYYYRDKLQEGAKTILKNEYFAEFIFHAYQIAQTTELRNLIDPQNNSCSFTAVCNKIKDDNQLVSSKLNDLEGKIKELSSKMDNFQNRFVTHKQVRNKKEMIKILPDFPACIEIAVSIYKIYQEIFPDILVKDIKDYSSFEITEHWEKGIFPMESFDERRKKYLS